jgi:chromosome segregation ATPase
MRTWITVVTAMFVCVGCAWNPGVRNAEQAKERATYYRTQAAALKKEIRRQNYVLEQLREQLTSAEHSLDLYEERAKKAQKRLGELSQRTATSEAGRAAIKQLTRNWENQREHMEISAQDQRSLILTLKEQIQMQRGFREDLEQRRKQLRNKAHRMQKRAKRMEQKSEKVEAQQSP